MCSCGCNTCESIRGPLLTEGKVKVKSLLSENLQYHVNKNIPLFESVFRIGSNAHLKLIKEARKMYSRDIINLCEEDEHLIKTHLGEFGIYEGEAVPLDLPMLEQTYSGFLRNPEDPDSEKFEPTGSVAQFREELRALFGKFKGDLKNPEFIKGVAQIMVNWKSLLRSQMDESKYEKEETIQQTIDRLKARIDDPNDGGNVPFLVQKIKDLEKSLNEYQGDGTNKISDDKLTRLVPKMPKGYVGKNTGIGEYTISTPDGEDIVLTRSKDKKNWFYEPSNVALKILNEDKKLTYNDFVQMTRDDMMAGAAPDEYPSDERVRKDAKYYYNRYLQGASVDDLFEAEFRGKDVKLNKPKRGGSKAYYVYVRDPKTKKIKKVSFGSGGLRAKIKNKKARNAYSARHRCPEKKDRTKAGYWSCNLPRYASMLGLGANMNTFW